MQTEPISRKRPTRPTRPTRSAPPRNTRRSVRAGAEDFGEFAEFDNHSTLPNVPDTKDWHYCWVRVSAQGVPDGKNIGKFMRGTVRYEIVPAEEFLELQHFRATHAAGGNGDLIQIDDVVLMRCPQAMHRKQQRYYEYLAAQQRKTIKAETKDRFKEAASHGVTLTYDDKEDGGVETVEPSEGGDGDE